MITFLPYENISFRFISLSIYHDLILRDLLVVYAYRSKEINTFHYLLLHSGSHPDKTVAYSSLRVRLY